MKLNEVITKCEESEKKIYLRSNVLNQSKGLTEFVKMVEKEAESNGVRFEIVGGSVKNVIPYKQDNWSKINTYFEDAKQVLFKNYVEFVYDNDYIISR